MDVAKVDYDVAYVAMVIHLCCKRLSPMFHLFFQTYVSSVFYPDVAYVSHILRMLQVFHLDVAMFFNGCKRLFSGVSHVCCKCFLQMLQK
jgi:hypothetical protein